jgi:hypothetical protein
MRVVCALLLSLPLLVVGETARADQPFTLGPGLRPYLHTDRQGRTLVDVCPERTPHGRRCFAQRVLRPGMPIPVPFGGGGSCSSPPSSGGATPPKGALTPAQILSHYNIPSAASAGGAIVALVDLPSVNAMSDVNAYRMQFSIPPLPACPVNGSGVPTPGGTPCFARVGTDGTVNSVTTADCPGWAGETALDMDMVSAACPDCSIVVVEAVDAFGTDLDEMDPIAATVLGAPAVSNSWGAPETGADDQSFYESPGILTVAASGDSAYLNEDMGGKAPSFPASSPYVLAVGGTSLYPDGQEVVWDDDAEFGGGGATTSGCSTEFPMPSYQSGSGFSFGSCTMRAAVDVSAAAEFLDGTGGGIAVYDADDGGWNSFVGTSASSPLVAAILVRLGLASQDNHSLFYQNGGAFNDVTTGNDDPRGICGGTVMCTAGVRWDGPTGLGTPNGTLLLALAGGTLEPEPDAGPPACTSNAQCANPTPACSPSGTCVGCANDSDCAGNAEGSACASSGSCVPCTKNADCPASAPECNTFSNTCYALPDAGMDAVVPPADAGREDAGTRGPKDAGARTPARAEPKSSGGCDCRTSPEKSFDGEGALLVVAVGLLAYGSRRAARQR